MTLREGLLRPRRACKENELAGRTVHRQECRCLALRALRPGERAVDSMGNSFLTTSWVKIQRAVLESRREVQLEVVKNLKILCTRRPALVLFSLAEF